jgi:hypothetical protein
MTQAITAALQPGRALHALTAYRQFMLYQLVPDAERPGKTHKYPVSPHTLQIASAHDLLSWADCGTALAVLAMLPPEQYGLAFVFTVNDPFWFIDVDNCLDGADWIPIARELCARFNGAAVEVSQSGRGLHLFGQGQAPRPRRCKSPAGFDLYTERRFVALTGDRVIGNAGTEHGAALAELVPLYLPPDAAGSLEGWTTEPVAEWHGPTDDDELIEKFLSSRTTPGEAFGNKAGIAALWNADADVLARAFPSDQGHGYDASRADSALATHLAFWTGKDCARIERLMRRSALARDKWDARPQWLEDTIQKAAALPNSAVYGAPQLPAEPVRAVEWTTEPVAGYLDQSEPVEVLAKAFANGSSRLSKLWNSDAPVEQLLPDLAFHLGSNCDAVLRAVLTRPGTVESDPLRKAIADVCARQTRHRGVFPADLGTLRVDPGQVEVTAMQIHEDLHKIPNLFVRDGRLTWVSKSGSLVPFTSHELTARLERHYRFVAGKDAKPAKTPETIVHRLLGKVDYPGVQRVAAAIPLPACRADGSVILEAGLDESTGLFLLKDAARPPVLLSDEGLRDALTRLWAPIREFPYANAESRGVALALILTTVCRPSLPNAPAFLVNAQAAGTGKTLLCQAFATMGLAPAEDNTRMPACSALPDDPAEQGKTIMAHLARGPRVVFFDNVVGVIRDRAVICSAMTSPSFEGRVLGATAMMRADNRAVWLLNGNNVGLVGDVVRRVMVISLDSDERPETKRHGFCPVEMIRNDLEGYRQDAIDVLATYAARGAEPEGLSGYASFDEWNKLVRGCVMWLKSLGVAPMEVADPMLTVEAQRAQDPAVELRERFTQAWLGRFGTDARVLNDVMGPSDSVEWAEALEEVCTRHGRYDKANLKIWMKENKGRITNGYKFMIHPQRTNRGFAWYLHKN